MSKVRKLTRAVVYSPSEERRTAFAREMSAACGVEVVPAAAPEDAARGLDIVCTATTAREPVLFGEWLSPGQHLNVVGSNFLAKAEIDVEVVKRANVVVDRQQGPGPAGGRRLGRGARPGRAGVDRRGRAGPRRRACARPAGSRPEDMTLFKSLGIGLEDIAVAMKVYQKAKEAGVGRWLEL